MIYRNTKNGREAVRESFAEYFLFWYAAGVVRMHELPVPAGYMPLPEYGRYDQDLNPCVRIWFAPIYITWRDSQWALGRAWFAPARWLRRRCLLYWLEGEAIHWFWLWRIRPFGLHVWSHIERLQNPDDVVGLYVGNRCIRCGKEQYNDPV